MRKASTQFVFFFLCILVLFSPISSFSWAKKPDAVSLYLDADRTGTKQSAFAIERGIRTALSEVGNALDGVPVKLVTLDHRGNSARSRYNLEQFAQDPDALAVYCGLHSPPVLASLDYINSNEILLLNPWAAAAPITRKGRPDNWVFRVSLDDSKAAGVISRFAINKGITRPHLFLERTGWGASNQRNFSVALKRYGFTAPAETWFDWGLHDAGARILLRNIISSGADAIFLVANAPEGKTIVKAMLELPQEQRIPIFSHWGITGGDFPQVITAEMRMQVELYFIQTNFSFLQMEKESFGQQVFARAQALFPDIRKPEDITAPAGFIHGYDATRLLIAAVRQAGLEESGKASRKAVKEALESLQDPVQGLIKLYSVPFSPFSQENTEAHEALAVEDLRMARYGSQNEIILLPFK